MTALPRFTKTYRFVPDILTAKLDCRTSPSIIQPRVSFLWRRDVEVIDNRSGQIILKASTPDIIQRIINCLYCVCFKDFRLVSSLLKSIRDDCQFDMVSLNIGQNICCRKIVKLMQEPDSDFHQYVLRTINADILWIDSNSIQSHEKAKIGTIDASLQTYKKLANIVEFKPFSFEEVPESLKILIEAHPDLEKVFMHFYSEHSMHPSVLSEPIVGVLLVTTHLTLRDLAQLSYNQIMKTYGVKEEDVPKVYSRLYTVWNENLTEIVSDQFPCQCAFDLIKPEFSGAAAAAARMEGFSFQAAAGCGR